MKKTLSQTVASLALLVLSVASVSAADRRTLHTGAPEVAAGLQRLGPLPAENRLQMAIGLPLRNTNALHSLLQQIYTPGSANFHHYLTPEQFAEQFGPTEEDYQKLISFAKTNGFEIAGTYSNRAVLDVVGKVSDIEKTFQVTLGSYQHPTENRRFFSPDVEPSVDATLPALYISGMDNYFIARPSSVHALSPDRARRAMGGSATNGLYLGSDFRNAYAPGTPLTGAGQVVGIYEGFDGYLPSDIQKYESIAHLPNVPLQNVLLNGVTNGPYGDQLEICLDIEVVIAMAPGLEAVNIYEGTNDVDIFNEMVSPKQGETRPNTITCSYGISGETNLEQALLEMAVQGQTFFYASGDSGAYQPDGVNTNTQQNFMYMTAVGGTELSTTNNANNVVTWAGETVWNNGAGDRSSGGVLSLVPIPDYQEGINMSVNKGSTVNRNIPDVAINADDFYVILSVFPTNGTPPMYGQVGGAQGTSGAAPLWAAYTALVNQQAASQGQPPVGFLNPALYYIAKSSLYSSTYHDITIGNNFNSGSPNLYTAEPGYDLCTGWGSPTGANFINALTGLSGPVFVNFNYSGSPQNGTYYEPFNTLTKGVNAVSAGGTVIIETAGSSSETLNITKAMTIIAAGGAATVGN
jgi:subtilase family serine protease